jgi:hypothetical protein
MTMVTIRVLHSAAFLAGADGWSPATGLAAALFQSAKDDVNRITGAFLDFGLGIAAGLAALAILGGFIMIATSHGSPARAEHGRSAIIAGLVGLVGAALTRGLLDLVKAIFPQLG